MAKQGGIKAYNSFVKGLITEASALSFPENASLEEENCILNRDGSRQRRLAMDFENLYALVDTGVTTSAFSAYAVSAYRWNNVSADTTKSFGVIQIGPKLWFVDLFSDTLSTNIMNGGVAVAVGTSGTINYQFADINGDLIVATGETEPKKLTYDVTADSITVSSISITMRDRMGVDDGLGVEDHPTTLTDTHKYNLLNQGWTSSKISSYYTSQGSYPSNAQTWYSGKDANDAFDPALLVKQGFGNTPAPTGHYLIDVFTRSASRTSLSGLTVPSDSDNGKITAITAHAGRIFYSGILGDLQGGDARSPKYTGYIFFSQTLVSNDDIGKCYASGDPSTEFEGDLVDTDGGYISIPQASNIYKLVSAKSHLLVFAENGVWQVYGGDRGFLATEYQVSKITHVGATNAASVVEAEGVIYYWSDGGIYAVAPEQVSGNFSASNVTIATIQSLYNDISSAARENVVGSYDLASKKITWLYNDKVSYDGASLKNTYDTELVLDTVLQAFYKNTISELASNTPMVAAYITTPNFLISDDIQNVTIGGDQVQIGGVDVIITTPVKSRGLSATKYVTLRPGTTNYEFTFSSFSDDSFMDWISVDSVGVDYSSYLITGHELYGDIARFKQVPYLFCFLELTEDGFTGSGTQFDLLHRSSCNVQARWEWTTSANSGRWGNSFQAYRLNRHYIPDDVSDTFDYGYGVVVTKNKLRGKGKALSIKFSSDTGKDFKLLGWATSVAMAATP